MSTEQTIAASQEKSKNQNESQNETETEKYTQKFNVHMAKSQKVLKSILLMNLQIENGAKCQRRETNELKPKIKEIQNSLKSIEALRILADDVSRVQNNLSYMFGVIDEVLISLSKLPEGFQQHLNSIFGEIYESNSNSN